YPERPYAVEIARRLFLPDGYTVRVGDGRLCLETDRALSRVIRELPALLLTLDRRTRLFLSSDELNEIATLAGDTIHDHPACRAIELAISGEQTPLRFLLPPGASGGAQKSEENSAEYFLNLEGCSDHLTLPQQNHARGLLARVNIDPKWLIYLP